MTACPRISAATDRDGVIRVVTTGEYEARKGPGVAAPCPGEPGIYLYHDSWADDARLEHRGVGEDCWLPLERPAEGGRLTVFPGESIRLIAPRGIFLGGFI